MSVAGVLFLRPDEGDGAPELSGAVSATNGTGILIFDERLSTVPGYRRYGYAVVGRHNARLLGSVPGTSLVYMSGVDVPSSFNSGVPQAAARRKGWLLKDASGSVIHSDSYDHDLGDVGSKSYQAAWLANVLKFAKKTKADGIFIDNVLADIKSWSTSRAYPTKYPSQAAWSEAMFSFVRAVGPPLKANGLQVVVNADGYVSDDPRSNDGSLTAAWWRKLAPYVTGLLVEYWMQNPIDFPQLRVVGSEWYEQWTGWQQLVSVAQVAGKDFFGVTYGPPTAGAAMRFARGSFMLDWDGRGGALFYQPFSDSGPLRGDSISNVGRPLGKKVQLSPGVWQRRFARAIVVVNATKDQVTVRVNGERRTIDAADGLIAPI